MSLHRLALLSILGAAAAASTPGAQAAVLGFPELAGPHKDLQIISKSGDATTYKLELDAIDENTGAESWTVTVSPTKITAKGEIDVGKGMKDLVERDCALASEKVVQSCKVTLGGTGLTPEQEKEIAQTNAQPPQTYPADGPEAYTLTSLGVGPVGPNDALGAAPMGGPDAGPMGGPDAGPMGGPDSVSIGAPKGAPKGNGGAPGGEMSGMGGMGGDMSGMGSGSGAPSGSAGPKEKKPDAATGGTSPPADSGASPTAATKTKAPKTSGAPPPAKQTTSGAARNSVAVSVPLFLIGLGAMLVV